MNKSPALIVLGMIGVLAISFGLALDRVQHTRALVAPLFTNPTPLGYTFGLTLFGLPVLILAVWQIVRQRRGLSSAQVFAFRVTAFSLALCGILLDVLFGLTFFNFNNTGAVIGWHFPGWSFGCSEIAGGDITNLPAFCHALDAPNPTPMSRFLFRHLAPETQLELQPYLDATPASAQPETTASPLNTIDLPLDLARDVELALRSSNTSPPFPGFFQLSLRQRRLAVVSAYPTAITSAGLQPGFHLAIPVEEIAFYALGIVVVLLIYIWGDEYWCDRYNCNDATRPHTGPPGLARWHVKSIIALILVFPLGFAVKALVHSPGCPAYFFFLAVVGLFPSAFLFPMADPHINWRAFSLALMFMLLVSLFWETSLAIPYQWWGYQQEFMLGLNINGFCGLPIEEPILWAAVTWAVIIIYESIYTWQCSSKAALQTALKAKFRLRSPSTPPPAPPAPQTPAP